MDENYQTSQQKDGAFSLVEGKSDSAATLTETENGGGKGSFTATSQQLRGEHSKPESE